MQKLDEKTNSQKSKWKLFKNEDIFRGKRICGSFNLQVIICVLIPEFWNGCNQCFNSEVIQKIKINYIAIFENKNVYYLSYAVKCVLSCVMFRFYTQQVTQTTINIKHGKCMLGIDWACISFSKSPGHDVQINGKNYIFWLLQFRILV